MPRVVVVGSLVADIVVRVPHFPSPGETVLATDSSTKPGGKGLCQAVMAQRAGAEVAMVGRVGSDDFGALLRAELERHGVDCTHLYTGAQGTSLGIPILDPSGANAIIGVPRASAFLTSAEVTNAAGAIRAADVLLLQLEVPLDACFTAISLAASANTLVVWNPAPAVHRLEDFLPDAVTGSVHWITPNEIEATQLSGTTVADVDSAREAAMRIRTRYPGLGVVVTLGALGAFATASDHQEVHVPAYPLTAVDTTGAGDAFTGAFAVALAEGRDLESAVRFGCAAGGLATTTLGAAPSLPDRAAIRELLMTNPQGSTGT